MEEDENKLNESFISRWSKRKSGNVSVEKNPEQKSYEIVDVKNKKKLSTKDKKDESDYEELNDEELLEKFKLPNPDKIKKEKGLDVFFKDGVPDRLRQIALRRVWKLNPIIRFADAEINDYHEDFTDAATVIEGMQTAYQVGKGYLTEMLENKDEESLPETTEIEKVVSDDKTKKKTKLVSTHKEKNIKTDKQASINKKKVDESNIKDDIFETDVQLVPHKLEDIPLEVVPEKPKPKMMVFKPKDNDNDYY
jgi:hypothetical protein